MAGQESLLSTIEECVGVGLISREQAESISAYEAMADRRRVYPREIFLYIGGVFVLMAVVFGLQMLWDDLDSLARVLVLAVFTASSVAPPTAAPSPTAALRRARSGRQ